VHHKQWEASVRPPIGNGMVSFVLLLCRRCRNLADGLQRVAATHVIVDSELLHIVCGTVCRTYDMRSQICPQVPPTLRPSS
jgi:hypothetical protein